MPYTSFYHYFREIAQSETRSLTILREDDIVPQGDYALMEMYCDDINCDCRRVFLDVYDWKRGKSMAYIAYGWESKEFYRNWFGNDNPVVIRDLKGPVLNDSSPQTNYAPAFLQLVKDVILSDPAYIERLKRHYQIFKEKVDPKHFPPSGAVKRVDVAKPKSKKRKRH